MWIKKENFPIYQNFNINADDYYYFLAEVLEFFSGHIYS